MLIAEPRLLVSSIAPLKVIVPLVEVTCKPPRPSAPPSAPETETDPVPEVTVRVSEPPSPFNVPPKLILPAPPPLLF